MQISHGEVSGLLIRAVERSMVSGNRQIKSEVLMGGVESRIKIKTEHLR